MPRRVLALFFALVMTVVACGDDAPGEATSATDSTEDGQDTTAGSFPRTIDHAMGTTEIPTQPERVVVLDTGELDSVMALGVTPVGAVRAPVEDGFLDYLQPALTETELVGTISDVNLEAVAALQPDLILSSKTRHEDLYDELSGIAPTVFTEAVGVVWKENFLDNAEALGLEDDAAAQMAAYDDRTADIAARLEDERGELPTISMVRFLPGETRLYQKASFIGTVLDDVGLPRPESQDVDEFALEISPELIEQADADIIFTTHYGAADESTRAEITGNPLWDTLGAVQRGDVYDVADDHWMLGIGIRAANLVLDDIDALLLG